MTVAPLRKRSAWTALTDHYRKIEGVHLRDLFAEDSRRGERLTAEAVAKAIVDYHSTD